MPRSFRPLFIAVPLVLMCSVAAIGADDAAQKKQEALNQYNNARQRRDAAIASRNDAQGDVNRHRAALPGAERAYNAALAAYNEAKAKETEIIQQLKTTMELDPRPMVIRKQLSEMQEGEQKRREELMPAVERTKEHQVAVANITESEAELEKLRSSTLTDGAKIADQAQKLMDARRKLTDLVDAELQKDSFYRKALTELETAKTAFAELERELNAVISENSDRKFASQRAGLKMSERDSKRLAYEQTRRSLAAAESRVDQMNRVISDAEADMRRYADAAGINQGKGKGKGKGK